ncbi:MAG: magnesium transporter MgtC [Chloroflexi bacterium HGW-Chloroflexi-10]|nr:MAG: magnesium transporter MgtC [Chloroflexi bacterium HGW-Chloroflexi-10]
MTLNPEDILKILLAVTAGGLIGIEREFRDKAAGFRTLIFICAGACLFTILSANLAPDTDPNRIAANIVTGVGFLGAGVILRDGGKVIGLTTAATIWLTAAVGMGIGGGEYLISGVMVLVAMIILWLFPFVENRIDNAHEVRKYEVICQADFSKIENLEKTFREFGLLIQNHSHIKCGEEMTCSWHASGSPSKHERLIRKLFEDTEIKELRS